MCGGSRSIQDASVANISQNYYRDIGLTGAQASQTIRALSRQGQAGVATVASQAFGSLDALLQSADNQHRQSFAFATSALSDITSLTRGTLADLTNATRDFSQRAIAASTGQDTPIQQLSEAGSNQDNRVLIYAVAGVALVALLSGK